MMLFLVMLVAWLYRCQSVCQSIQRFGPDGNMSTTVEFCTHIHGPQRMNPNEFGDFSSSAPMRLTFVVLCEISQQLLRRKSGSWLTRE